MLYPENPNFEDEFEAEIKTKDQRFKEVYDLDIGTVGSPQAVQY